jgi:nucleoside-diphosphate-sugar epimerase
MRVFLTGANGWIGSMIVQELIEAGHSVVGLVRNKEKGEALVRAGATPMIGSIEDLNLLRRAAGEAEGVIHTAFGLDLSKMGELAAQDSAAIEAVGEAFFGSQRPLVVTSGFLETTGEKVKENARPPVMPEFPRASEQTALALAARGIHATVVRNPRSVHGHGETHGFVPMLAEVARSKGVSAYVGEGRNLWPAVHRRDAARVYRLALERHGRGEVYHAVAEEGVAYREIAEAIGRQLGLPAVSLTPDEAAVHFGALALWVQNNGPAANEWTREVLGWRPSEVGIVADIEQSDYSR